MAVREKDQERLAADTARVATALETRPLKTWRHETCSLCGQPWRFIFLEGKVFRDHGCRCNKWDDLVEVDAEAIASFIAGRPKTEAEALLSRLEKGQDSQKVD